MIEEPQAGTDTLIEKIKEYVKARTQLALYITAEKITEFYASVVANLVVAAGLIMAFLFASLALAFYLSEVLKSTWAGFLCVAGIYLILALLLQLIKKSAIEKPIMDKTVKSFFAERGNENGK